MKNLMLIAAVTLASVCVNGQELEAIAKALESSPSMEVKNDLLKFNKETQNGFTSYLNATPEVAEKKWKEFMLSKYSADVKTSKKGAVSENVTMRDISEAPVDVVALFIDDENGCKMEVFYKISGHYINTKEHPKETTAALASLKSYQKMLYVTMYEKVLVDQRKVHEKEQKALDKLMKESEKISKQMTSEEGDISKSEQTIISSEQKITELHAQIETLKGEITQSKATIVQLKETKEKKESEVSEQSEKVTKQASRIEKLKLSAERMNN